MYWAARVLLGLGEGSLAQAHDEAPVVEGSPALDGVLLLRVRDLHLGAGLDVVDHVTVYHVSVQTLHSTCQGQVRGQAPCE